MKTIVRTGKHGPVYRYGYSGTFVTRDGALLVVPPAPRRSSISKTGRSAEKKMLQVLFWTGLNPRSDPSAARRCETRDGLRSEFSKMVKAAGVDQKRARTGTNTFSNSAATDRRYDCLMLLGAARGDPSYAQGPSKVRGGVNARLWRKHDNSGTGDVSIGTTSREWLLP